MKAFGNSLRVIAVALSVTFGLAGNVMAQDEPDMTAGKKIFNKCKACHTIKPSAKNGIGPNLNGLFGRKAGTAEGFAYSDAMKAAGAAGRVWDDATIAEYLRDPKGVIPDNKMVFVGIKDEADLTNLIAFLKEKSNE